MGVKWKYMEASSGNIWASSTSLACQLARPDSYDRLVQARIPHVQARLSLASPPPHQQARRYWCKLAYHHWQAACIPYRRPHKPLQAPQPDLKSCCYTCRRHSLT